MCFVGVQHVSRDDIILQRSQLSKLEIMGDPEIHEEVEQVVEDRLGGPPHGQQVSESLQYFILIPAVLAFILIGMIYIYRCYTVTYELYYMLTL